MPKTYALTAAAQALETDIKSLRRWIKIEKWDVEKQTTPYDRRIIYLTEEQVKTLAQAHTRQWPPREQPATEQSHGTPSAINQIEGRLSELEERPYTDPEILDDWMKDAAAKIQDLESKYTATLLQISDILIELKELKDWKASQEARPKSTRKPKDRTAVEPNYQPLDIE